MAIAASPTSTSDDEPSLAIEIALIVSALISSSLTATTARSLSVFIPFTTASTSVLSPNVTLRLFTFSTTCAFVTIRSSVSFAPIIIPEPLTPAS